VETCRLTVLAPEEIWEADVDDWTSLVILAALSAEPESIAELVAAVRRYLPDHRLFDEPPQPEKRFAPDAHGPWCLIDLPGRTVVAGSEFELPEPRGAYEATADDHAEGFPFAWLDIPSDWLFRQAGSDWREVMAERASARAAAPRLDARAVLFGPPLLEYLTDGVLKTPAHPADEEREYERTRVMHAKWLMTARADLGGRTPREVLLAKHGLIGYDLEHRSEQWSRQGHAPPPLPLDSDVYRLGGFGTIEIVFYFDLVRALLAEAWQIAAQAPRPTREFMMERLAQFRDRWLHEPNESTSMSMTPAAMIESERRRMPIASDGSHLDCDCPICQAEAEGAFGSAPAFLMFDGHHLELEDEFAFSLIETREAWEREQEEYRRYSEEMDRKERERKAARDDDDDWPSDSAWKASHVNWDALAGSSASPRQALLWLGFPLAELVANLKDRADGADHVKTLNTAYATFRMGQDEVVAESPAQAFREALETVSGRFPDLTAKCADLQSHIDEILRRVAQSS
jgi:hypothetical protein